MAIDYTKFLKPTPVATKSKIDYSKFVQKKYGLPTKSVVIKKEPAKVGTQSPKLTTPKIKDLAKGDNLFADLPFDYDLQGSKKNIVGYQDKKPIFALPKHLDGGTYTKEVTEEGKKESRNIPTETKKEIAGDYVNTLKEVNHIISVARGGTKDRENLEALRTNANFLQKFQKLFGRQFEPSDFTDEQRQEGRVAIEKEIDRDVKSGKISNEEAITKLKRWDFEQDLKVKAKDIAEDTIKTFFKSGSKLFTEAIPEALNFEYKGVGFGKLVDALKKGSDIEPDKAKEFLDKSPIQQYYSPEVVKQLPSATFRGFNNIGVGILSSISSLLGTAEWAGVDKAKPMADKLDKWTEEASSANPKFTDALQQGIGSAATFYLPGAGAMKFSQVIASFSPKLASLAGAGAMGLLESAAESGAVYRDSQKSGDSVEISDLKARGTFLANVALNIVTNKLGIFSDKTKGLFLKGLLSAPLEALQEGTQQLIVNYANDRPLMEGIKEASAIGGILGGFMGAGVSSKTNSLSTKKEPDKELKDLLNKEEAKESATEDPIPSPSVPQIDYSKVINSEQVEQKPQETPSDPLTTEARKYKSAEEFVEAQPKFFHGTYSKDVATKIDREGLAFQKGGTNRGDKISLTKSEDIALTYSGKEGGIVEVFPAKNARIATAKDLPEVKFTTFEDGKKLFNASDAIDAARKKGFDGVDISSFDKKSIGNDVLNEELVILNPSKFQTKSQLTDIWERANKVTASKAIPEKVFGGEVFPEELIKYKTGEVPTQVAKSVEQKAENYLQKAKPQLFEKLYKEGEATVIDPDVFKAEVPGFSKFGEQHANLVHEPSSKMAREFYEYSLNKNQEPLVRFTAGGSGSGKSELLLPKLTANNKGVVVDTTLSKFNSAKERIELALSKGKEVKIDAIIPNLNKAWEFVQKRAITDGRTVPLEDFAQAHAGFVETLSKIIKEYRGNKSVGFSVSDVRAVEKFKEQQKVFRGEGDIVRVTKKDEILDILDDLEYTKDKIINQLKDVKLTEKQQRKARARRRAKSDSSRGVPERRGVGEKPTGKKDDDGVLQDVSRLKKPAKPEPKKASDRAGFVVEKKPETAIQEKPVIKKVPREQLPVKDTAGEQKVSRLEARTKTTLANLNQEQIEELGLATYEEMNKADQIKKATEYVANNEEEAIDVLLGKKQAPKGLLRNSIFIALQQSASDSNNADLALKLASLESTRLGQEISILTEITEFNPVSALNKLIKIHEKTLAKRTGESKANLKEKRIRVAKQKIKKASPTQDDWSSFIEKIKC